MVRTSCVGSVALLLGLLSVLVSTPARAQVPAANLGNPSSPNFTRPQETNGIPTGTPLPAVAQAEPGPPPLPDLGPALPGASMEATPPTLPLTEGGQTPQGGRPDPFASTAGGFSPFLNPVVGHAPLRTEYRAIWLPSQPVGGQPTNLGYVQQDVSVSFPLWQCGDTDEWLASASVRSEVFHTHAMLLDTRQPFPDDLWNIRFGTTYRHLFENGWIAGGTLSVGSASDQPFHGINEMTAGVHAFLRVPQGEHNAWLFSLSYSPVSELPFPIPGVAYVWQPSENFRANLGLPFQVMWRPIDDLTLDLSYMLLTTVHARATYRLCRPVRVYVAYASENEAYLLADRVSSNDRFFNVDQRLTAGVQVHISPRTSLDFSSGYVFDHHFFEGKNITNGTHFNRVDVDSGPFLAVQLQVRW
jgi:hypothetical protein